MMFLARCVHIASGPSSGGRNSAAALVGRNHRGGRIDRCEQTTDGDCSLLRADKWLAAKVSRCSCSGRPENFRTGARSAKCWTRRAPGSVPHVIPWGAGKWFFGRGKLLSQLLREHRAPPFFLGDEGGRPAFWRYPRHFKEAARLGVRDLPGTDPLPFAHDVDKVGRVGFRAQMNLDEKRPARSLLQVLEDGSTPLERFARLEPFTRFVRNQVGMQLRKRHIILIPRSCAA